MTPDAESAAPAPPRDDGLEWLREIRRQLAAEANYDPAEMGRRIREVQNEYKGRVVRTRRVLVPVEDKTHGVYRQPATADAESSCVVREEPPAL